MNQSINQAIREMAKSVSGGHAAVAAVHHPRRRRKPAYAVKHVRPRCRTWPALPHLMPPASCAVKQSHLNPIKSNLTVVVEVCVS